MHSYPPDIVQCHHNLYSYIWTRPHIEDESTNILIIGPPGTGKSTVGVLLGYTLARKSNGVHKFNFSKNVFYSFENFIKAIDKAKRGEVLIFDEAGTQEGVYNRNWFSEQNKGASELMQTVRAMNLILIYITPAKKFIDVQIRKLFNVQINMLRKDIRRGVSFGIVKKVSWNPETDDEYNEYFRKETDLGLKQAVTYWAFPKPPKYIVDQVKEGEKENKEKLRKNIIARILEDKKTVDQKRTLDYEALEKQAREKIDLITKPDKMGNPKISANLIRVVLKVGQPAAATIKEMLESAAYRGDLDIST